MTSTILADRILTDLVRRLDNARRELASVTGESLEPEELCSIANILAAALDDALSYLSDLREARL